MNIPGVRRRTPSRSSTLLLLVITVTLGMLWFSDPQRQYKSIGKLDDFAPSPNPYPVIIDDSFVYVVNTGTEILALNRLYTTPIPAWNCKVVWVPINHRFEDPCSGAKFSLDGSWLATPFSPTKIEPRGLQRYAVQLWNDKILINIAWPTPGVPGEIPSLNPVSFIE